MKSCCVSAFFSHTMSMCPAQGGWFSGGAITGGECGFVSEVAPDACAWRLCLPAMLSHHGQPLIQPVSRNGHGLAGDLCPLHSLHPLHCRHSAPCTMTGGAPSPPPLPGLRITMLPTASCTAARWSSVACHSAHHPTRCTATALRQLQAVLRQQAAQPEAPTCCHSSPRSSAKRFSQSSTLKGAVRI